MGTELAELVFIVDRSGSMSSIASDMEGTIESVMKEQKGVNEENLRVTFVRFDSEYEEVFSNTPVKDVEDIKINPRGMTALLDAMGKTVNTFKTRFLETEEKDRPEKVLFIIITDGQENASVEYKRSQVFDLIETMKKDYNWGFTFIGANQDAISEGSGVGIRAGDSLNFMSTSKGVRRMSDEVTCYATSYLRTGAASFNNMDSISNDGTTIKADDSNHSTDTTNTVDGLDKSDIK